MMTTLNTKSYANFYSSIPPKSPSSFPTSMSNFSSPTKSSSPNQINNTRWGPPLITINRGCASSSRFSIDNRNSSSSSSNDHRSIASSSINQTAINSNKALINEQKKACMCAPTTHPGSFRCSLHKNVNVVSASSARNCNKNIHSEFVRRSAIANSIVRIGIAEGELMKRSLVALIRRCSNKQRPRRCDFQPKQSRLSVMSKAGD